MRRTIELIAFFAALLLAAMAFHAWLAAHDEQQRLAATLATQKQLLDAADSRERTRDAALNQTLAQIAQLKSQKLTPQQIIAKLPAYLPLPQPISLDASSTPSAARVAKPTAANRSPQQGIAPSTSSSTSSTSPISSTSAPSSASSLPSGSQSLPSAPAAKIPAADLQPLFDFVQDCRACQAKLAVAQQNASDDSAKIAALSKERDAAITASKGGTIWRRFRRNLLWFAIGAGAGASLAISRR